jgi:hypothetical protein
MSSLYASFSSSEQRQTLSDLLGSDRHTPEYIKPNDLHTRNESIKHVDRFDQFSSIYQYPSEQD